MKPDLDNAALKAYETIIKYRVCTAPVDPLKIIKEIPGVIAIPYAEMAEIVKEERKNLISAFGESADAVTFVEDVGDRLKYFVVYNQHVPFYVQQRALARELGHIILKHDGTKPEDVRMKEAIYFSRHLLCPRPLLMAVQDAGIALTIEIVGNLTGCYKNGISKLAETPGAVIPAAINKIVKDQFSEYISDFLTFQDFTTIEDDSDKANFGTYMDNYQE